LGWPEGESGRQLGGLGLMQEIARTIGLEALQLWSPKVRSSGQMSMQLLLLLLLLLLASWQVGELASWALRASLLADNYCIIIIVIVSCRFCARAQKLAGTRASNLAASQTKRAGLGAEREKQGAKINRLSSSQAEQWTQSSGRSSLGPRGSKFETKT